MVAWNWLITLCQCQKAPLFFKMASAPARLKSSGFNIAFTALVVVVGSELNWTVGWSSLGTPGCLPGLPVTCGVDTYIPQRSLFSWNTLYVMSDKIPPPCNTKCLRWQCGNSQKKKKNPRSLWGKGVESPQVWWNAFEGCENRGRGGRRRLGGRWFKELGAVFVNILGKEWDVLHLCGPSGMETLLFRQGLPPLGWDIVCRSAIYWPLFILEPLRKLLPACATRRDGGQKQREQTLRWGSSLESGWWPSAHMGNVSWGCRGRGLSGQSNSCASL